MVWQAYIQLQLILVEKINKKGEIYFYSTSQI